MHRPALTPQAHFFNRQALHAPREGAIKQCVHTELTTCHRTMRAVPAPAQMHHIGPRSTCEAALMLDELAGEHRDEHDADKISRARRQIRDQVVDGTGCQVHWRSSQVESSLGWLRHPPSFSKPGCFLLPNW